MNNVLPYPESHTFFEVLCCLAGILGVVLLAKRCWIEFLGGKNQGDDASGPRREVEAGKRGDGERMVSGRGGGRERRGGGGMGSRMPLNFFLNPTGAF